MILALPAKRSGISTGDLCWTLRRTILRAAQNLYLSQKPGLIRSHE